MSILKIQQALVVVNQTSPLLTKHQYQRMISMNSRSDWSSNSILSFVISGKRCYWQKELGQTFSSFDTLRISFKFLYSRNQLFWLLFSTNFVANIFIDFSSCRTLLLTTIKTYLSYCHHYDFALDVSSDVAFHPFETKI